MSVTELTGVIGAVGGIIVAMATYYGTVRSSRSAAVASTVTTWQALSAEYKADRDAARVELDAVDTKYRARIRELEQDHQHQITAMQARVTQLETDLAAVTRNQQNPP